MGQNQSSNNNVDHRLREAGLVTVSQHPSKIVSEERNEGDDVTGDALDIIPSFKPILRNQELIGTTIASDINIPFTPINYGSLATICQGFAVYSNRCATRVLHRQNAIGARIKETEEELTRCVLATQRHAYRTRTALESASSLTNTRQQYESALNDMRGILVNLQEVNALLPEHMQVPLSMQLVKLRHGTVNTRIRSTSSASSTQGLQRAVPATTATINKDHNTNGDISTINGSSNHDDFHNSNNNSNTNNDNNHADSK